jgi:hypothetical protein
MNWFCAREIALSRPAALQEPQLETLVFTCTPGKRATLGTHTCRAGSFCATVRTVMPVTNSKITVRITVSAA